jgi:hypothetical protein
MKSSLDARMRIPLILTMARLNKARCSGDSTERLRRHENVPLTESAREIGRCQDGSGNHFNRCLYIKSRG